jgi:hypothetical protein
MSDFAYVIRSPSAELRKVFRRDTAGVAHKTSFDPTMNGRFNYRRVELGSFDALKELLISLRDSPQEAILRGEYIGEEAAEVVNRCAVARDNVTPCWREAEGHHWVCIDIDKLDLTKVDGLGPDFVCTNDADDFFYAALTVKQRWLPEPFRTAQAFCHLSGSYGADGNFNNFRAHLWFWFDRPVCDTALRKWAELTKVADRALFSCNQIHYTADPGFINMEPFINPEDRMFTLPGEECVIAPDLLTVKSALPKPETKSKEVTVKKKSLSVSDMFDALPDATPTNALDAAVIESGSKQQVITDKQLAYAKKALAGMLTDALTWQPGTRRANMYKKACHLTRLLNSGLITREQCKQTAETMCTVVYPDDEEKQQKALKAMRDAFVASKDEAYDLEKLCPPDPEVKTKQKYLQAAESGEGPAYVDFNSRGEPTSSYENTVALLRHKGVRVGYNLLERRTECIIDDKGPVIAEQAAATTKAKIRVFLDNAKIFKSDSWTDTVLKTMQKAYHPALEWMKSKPWDGKTDYVEQFFRTLVLAGNPTEEDVAYYRKLFRMWMMSAVAAAALPADAKTGIAAQGVLVLQGAPAALKTRWAASLCGERPVEGKPDEGEQTPESAAFLGSGTIMNYTSDQVRCYDALMSRWIFDFSELDGTIRSTDTSKMKELITNNADRWMPKYASETATFPRRTVFLGTVNPKSFLRDPTGNRRFWVIPVKMCCVAKEHAERHGAEYYIQALDMQQVWAHAYALYQGGETYFPDLDFIEKINEYNAQYEIHNEDNVDLAAFFKPVPEGMPAAKWSTATEVRRHFLKCMRIEENTDDARALWTRASQQIVKKWGPTVKSGPNRYPVHLIEPDGSSA